MKWYGRISKYSNWENVHYMFIHQRVNTLQATQQSLLLIVCIVAFLGGGWVLETKKSPFRQRENNTSKV